MKQKPFIIILGFFVFLAVILGILFISQRLGISYGDGLQSLVISNDQPIPTLKEKRRIRKIIVDEAEQCLEVTADGVVRTYTSCGGQLIDSNRLFDPKRIIELFEYTSRVNTSLFRTKPKGLSIRLILETDTGTEVVYIPVSTGSDSISQVIDLIKGDLPQPTPTSGPTLIPTPTLPGTTIIPTITPTPTMPPWVTPQSTPLITPKPFVCEYVEESGNRRPFYVSNFICTSQPSPAP